MVGRFVDMHDDRVTPLRIRSPKAGLRWQEDPELWKKGVRGRPIGEMVIVHRAAWLMSLGDVCGCMHPTPRHSLCYGAMQSQKYTVVH